MDELSTETKREIVKLVFPDLRYGGDPDIERYFELRKDGRASPGPLHLQRRPPRPLSRRFRRGSSSSSSTARAILATPPTRKASSSPSPSALRRIRQANIDLITAPLEKADLSDALRALKAVESVLSRLPGETERRPRPALPATTDSPASSATARSSSGRALDLVREYDAVSRADDRLATTTSSRAARPSRSAGARSVAAPAAAPRGLAAGARGRQLRLRLEERRARGQAQERARRRPPLLRSRAHQILRGRQGARRDIPAP